MASVQPGYPGGDGGAGRVPFRCAEHWPWRGGRRPVRVLRATGTVPPASQHHSTRLPPPRALPLVDCLAATRWYSRNITDIFSLDWQHWREMFSEYISLELFCFVYVMLRGDMCLKLKLYFELNRLNICISCYCLLPFTVALLKSGNKCNNTHRRYNTHIRHHLEKLTSPVGDRIVFIPIQWQSAVVRSSNQPSWPHTHTHTHTHTHARTHARTRRRKARCVTLLS